METESTLEGLESQMLEYARQMTFDTEWRNYEEEYDDLICWEGYSDIDIFSALEKIGNEKGCSFQRSTEQPLFGSGIIGKLTIDDFIYSVGRCMVHKEGNPYDSDSYAYNTLTLFDENGNVIDLSDDSKKEMHSINLQKVENALWEV